MDIHPSRENPDKKTQKHPNKSVLKQMILKNKLSLETANRKQVMELRLQCWKLMPLDWPWQLKSSRLASFSQWPSTLGVHTIYFEKFIMGEVDLIT